MTDDAKRIAELEAEVATLKRSLTFQRQNNHDRNVALDALHFVWCDGGCRAGVHRFGDRGRGPLTEEIVLAAERNTKRMRSWLVNHQFRQEHQR